MNRRIDRWKEKQDDAVSVSRGGGVYNYHSKIQFQHGNKELWPGYGFKLHVHCDLDYGDMTLSEGHDTNFDHRQYSQFYPYPTFQ